MIALRLDVVPAGAPSADDIGQQLGRHDD